MPAAGGLRACRRAGPAQRQRTSRAARSSRRGRHLRAGARSALAAGVVESVALTAVDELTAVGVIRQHRRAPPVPLPTPTGPASGLRLAPAGWLLAAHERSAAALAGRGASATERAHHVERSGRQGDARAVAVPPRGRRGSRPPCPGERRPVVRTMRCGLLRDDAPAADRVELLLARAGALATRPLRREPRRPARELPARPRRTVALRIRLTTACAGTNISSASTRRPTNAWPTRSTGLDDPGSAEAVALMLELAMDGVSTCGSPRSRLAGQAPETARPLGDPPLIATAAAALLTCTALCGRVPERSRTAPRRPHSSTSLGPRPGPETGLRHPPRRRRALPGPVRRRRRPRGARDRRGQSDRPTRFHPLRFMLLAWVRMLHGELADGAEKLDEAIEESRLLGNQQSLAGLILNRSLTALAAGDLELAVCTAGRGRPDPDMDEGLIPAAAPLALSAALLEAGDPGCAVDSHGPTGGPGLPFMPGGSFRAKWLELLTRCSLALGRRRRRTCRCLCPDTVVAREGLPMATAMAERAAATVALGAAILRPHEAGARLGDRRRPGRNPGRGRPSRTLAGRALAEPDGTSARRRELETAAAALHACGAWRYRDATEFELRRLGHHVHRRTNRGDKRTRSGVADPTRETGRRPRRGSLHEPRDRDLSLPQPQDGRDPHPQHAAQARR